MRYILFNLYHSNQSFIFLVTAKGYSFCYFPKAWVEMMEFEYRLLKRPKVILGHCGLVQGRGS